MIQEIEPFIYKNAYKPEKPDQNSYVMYFKETEALIKRNGEEIGFVTFGELEKMNPHIYEDATYLFSIDRMKFYLAEKLIWDKDEPFEMMRKEKFRNAAPGHLAFAGITAYQLYSWYKSHKFCGGCGSPMKKDKKERMLYCEHCGQMEYPKICPAVIVAVTDGNRLLMSRYAGRTYKKYALIAGFAEIGETIEETVKREVMEEVGLKVKNITYYKSQPWSFSDTLLFGFFAELDGSPEITLNREELALAQWFEREEIPKPDNYASLTNEMIRKFNKK